MSDVSKLHWAVRKHKINKLTHFIEHGVDVNAIYKGETAFTLALGVNCNPAVELIIASRNFNPNARKPSNISPLYLAVKQKRLDLVNRLLAMGALVNCADSRGNTPLIASAWTGDVKTAQLLIEHGAIINQADLNGHTPLHHACTSVSVKVAQLLVAHQADVNHVTNNEKTPLMCALPSVCKSQFSEKKTSDMLFICEFLIDAGSNLNTKDATGKTALHCAVQSGDIHGLCLLAERGCEISTRDSLWHTPFQTAILQQHPKWDIARILLHYGADATETVPDVYGPSFIPPLSFLLQYRNSQTTPESSWSYNELLKCMKRCVYPTPAFLQAFSPEDYRASNTETPGLEAAMKIFQRLQANQPRSLKFQARLTIRQAMGSRNLFSNINALELDVNLSKYLALDLHPHLMPLSQLSYLYLHIKDHANDLVKEIIDSRRDINFFINGKAPLAVALEAGNTEVARMILAKPKLCPGRINSLGDSALHVVARLGRHDLIDDVVQVYTSVDLANNKHLTPLQVAFQAGHFTIAATLINRGADVNLLCLGVPLLHMAAACGKTDIVELILSRGVDPNMQDCYLNTPLHVAASKARLYLQHHIPVPGLYKDALAENLDNLRMLLYDCQPRFVKTVVGHAQVARCLISHGASLTKVNEESCTPMECAQLVDATEIIDIFDRLSLDVGTGRADVGTGRADVGTGMADVGTGMADVGTGGAGVGTGGAGVGTGGAGVGAGGAGVGTGGAVVGTGGAGVGTGGADGGGTTGRADGGGTTGRADGGGTTGRADGGGTTGRADGGTTGRADGGTTGRADVGTTERADVGTTGRADVGTTERADVGGTERADVGTTERADVGTTERADVGTTGRADVGTTGRADVGTTGRADVGGTERADVGGTETAF